MTMHNLPQTIFRPEDGRYPQRQRRDIAPTANLGPELLYLYEIRQARRHTLRYVLEAGSVAIPIVRCRFLHRLNDLSPSARKGTKRVAQGHIVSLGKERLGGSRVSFHELTQSQMVSFNHLIEIFGVEGHLILLVVRRASSAGSAPKSRPARTKWLMPSIDEHSGPWHNQSLLLARRLSLGTPFGKDVERVQGQAVEIALEWKTAKSARRKLPDLKNVVSFCAKSACYSVIAGTHSVV
jgi:hypothetical protein